MTGGLRLEDNFLIEKNIHVIGFSNVVSNRRWYHSEHIPISAEFLWPESNFSYLDA